MSTIKVHISTTIEGPNIVQCVSQEDLDGRVRNMWQDVVYMKDAQVREALIKMGWTPPKEDTQCLS